jgi:hypothetical protein
LGVTIREKRGYLGIDESNHGRSPEIYVAVYSRCVSDLERKRLGKKRREVDILELLGGREFRFIVFDSRDVGLIGVDNLMYVACSKFIRHFGATTELSQVLIDGRLEGEQKRMLEKIATGNSIVIPKIRPIRNGDIRVPLVNIADHIARLLFRYYAGLSSERFNPYPAYRIG